MFANSTNRFGFILAPSFQCHPPNRPNLHTLDMVAKFDRSLVEVPKTITCVARHAVIAIFSRTRTSNQLEVCTGGVGPPNPPPIRAQRSTRGSFPRKKKPSKKPVFRPRDRFRGSSLRSSTCCDVTDGFAYSRARNSLGDTFSPFSLRC